MKTQIAKFLAAFVDLELHVLALYRLSRVCLKLPVGGWLFSKFFRHLIRVASGCDISPKAIIGKKVRLIHPLGIVIGDGVIIHDNVRIWQQVTVGSHGKKGEELAYPEIGENVRIYAKASIIGSVTIGEDATIGAHSLVMRDVPKGKTAIGIPAKVIN